MDYFFFCKLLNPKALYNKQNPVNEVIKLIIPITKNTNLSVFCNQNIDITRNNIPIMNLILLSHLPSLIISLIKPYVLYIFLIKVYFTNFLNF